jgi:hypothetical protein
MKKQYLNAFNNQFAEFLEEVLSIFPGHVDITTFKNTVGTLKKANPGLLVRIWHDHVCKNYMDEIEKGNIKYFLEKDYSQEMQQVADTKGVIDAIDKIRGPINEMGEQNQKTSMQYILNLSKLSKLYTAC